MNDLKTINGSRDICMSGTYGVGTAATSGRNLFTPIGAHSWGDCKDFINTWMCNCHTSFASQSFRLLWTFGKIHNISREELNERVRLVANRVTKMFSEYDHYYGIIQDPSDEWLVEINMFKQVTGWQAIASEATVLSIRPPKFYRQNSLAMAMFLQVIRNPLIAVRGTSAPNMTSDYNDDYDSMPITNPKTYQRAWEVFAGSSEMTLHEYMFRVAPQVHFRQYFLGGPLLPYSNFELWQVSEYDIDESGFYREDPCEFNLVDKDCAASREALCNELEVYPMDEFWYLLGSVNDLVTGRVNLRTSANLVVSRDLSKLQNVYRDWTKGEDRIRGVSISYCPAISTDASVYTAFHKPGHFVPCWNVYGGDVMRKYLEVFKDHIPTSDDEIVIKLAIDLCDFFKEGHVYKAINYVDKKDLCDRLNNYIPSWVAGEAA